MDDIQKSIICLDVVETMATVALIEVYLERYGSVMEAEKPEAHRGLVSTQSKLRALLARAAGRMSA